jgi:hypothetical protein
MQNHENLPVTLTQTLDWWSNFLNYLQDAPFRFAAPIIATCQQAAQAAQQREAETTGAPSPAPSPILGNGADRIAPAAP